MVGVVPAVWQIMHERRATPATVVSALACTSETSVAVWHPVPKQAELAAAGVWAVVMPPCCGALEDAVWQPPCAQPFLSQGVVRVFLGLG